jgi:hypothetical protein
MLERWEKARRRAVRARGNASSGDRAPRSYRRHCTFTGQGSNMTIAISIGPSAVIDTEPIALSRASIKA